jgi:hypothetical protein
LEQGHASVQQCGELARELGDVTRVYAALEVELKPTGQIELTLNSCHTNAVLFKLLTDVCLGDRVNHTLLNVTIAVNAAPSEAALSHGGSRP